MAKRRGYGEGAIYPIKKNGQVIRYAAAVDLGMIGSKRKRKVIYGVTRKEVAEKLRALQRDKDARRIVVENQTVAQFLERWLNNTVAPRNKPRPQDSYRDMVRLHITPLIGQCKLAKLTPEHIQTMLSILSEKGLSPRTVNYARAILRRALNQALKWKLVPDNAARDVEPPRIEKPTRTILTTIQVKAFLAAVRGHRYEVLYRVALTLGLRRGEILALQWSDIDFESATLKVSGSLQRSRCRQVSWLPCGRTRKPSGRNGRTQTTSLSRRPARPSSP